MLVDRVRARLARLAWRGNGSRAPARAGRPAARPARRGGRLRASRFGAAGSACRDFGETGNLDRLATRIVRCRVGPLEEDSAQRQTSRQRRPDGRVRRLGHAGRVLRHHRRASGRAHARRAVRRQPHGPDRAGRRRRARRRPVADEQRRLAAAPSARCSTRRSRRRRARSSTTCWCTGWRTTTTCWWSTPATS